MESKTNSDKLDDIATRLLQLQEQFQDSLLGTRQTRQMQEDFYARMANMELKQDSIPVQTAPSPLFFPLAHDHRPHFQHTPFKMEFPRFDGNDALGWIFKITQFFNFHCTPEEQRLSIVSFYMDGPALG